MFHKAKHTIQQSCTQLPSWLENLCLPKKLDNVYNSFIHNQQNKQKQEVLWWIKKLWYHPTTEWYSAMKRNELSSYEKKLDS